MKLIIAGSRDLIVDPAFISGVLDKFNVMECDITEIVSGCANGIDSCGELYANRHKLPLVKFPADWKRDGKAAGPIRNALMAQYADKALVIMLVGGTKGSQNMIKQMKKLNKEVFVYEFNPQTYRRP